MYRRALLACAGVSVSAFAGCTGWTGDPEDEEESDEPIDPEELEGYIRPARDPETVPAELSCDKKEFMREYQRGDRPPVYGDGEMFSIRINELSFMYGDEIEIQMTNTTSETVETGLRDSHNFELYTEAGWQEVRGWEDGQEEPSPDDAENHEPGDGFRWVMEFTEEGIVRLENQIVCPELQSGRYRFVFYGTPGDPIAVAFDLNRDETESEYRVSPIQIQISNQSATEKIMALTLTTAEATILEDELTVGEDKTDVISSEITETGQYELIAETDDNEKSTYSFSVDEYTLQQGSNLIIELQDDGLTIVIEE